MLPNAREIVELFGFKIRIDPSWFIIAALIVWSLSTSYFPEVLPNKGRNVLILISLVAMLGLFASLILHELAHSLVARRFNLKVGSITLFIFGGVAELERDPESAISEFWIAIAGPAMSFLLGLVFLAGSRIAAPVGMENELSALLKYLGIINLLLGGFNLLPAFPLDGGRILRAALWHLKQDVLAATKTACKVGTFFAFLLICLGFLAFFSTQFIAGIWQILIGMFILVTSSNIYNELAMRLTLKDFTVSSLMTRSPWVVDAEDTLQDLVDQVMLKHNVSFVPVIDGKQLLGYVDAAMIKTIERDNWNETRVGDIYAAVDEDNTTRAEARTEDVFDQMAKTGNRKLLIVDKGRLEGVISLSDLMAFLSVRSRLGLAPETRGRNNRHSTAHA